MFSLRSVEASLEPVLGRRTKYKQISGAVRLEVSWSPLHSSPHPASVFIYSANNLGHFTDGRGAPVTLQGQRSLSPLLGLNIRRLAETLSRQTSNKAFSSDSEQIGLRNQSKYK